MSAEVNLDSGEQPVASSIPGPRRVRLTLERIDPLSAAKVGFLVSAALGVMQIVASALLWFVLDAMKVFSSLESFIGSIGAGSLTKLLEMLHFSRVLAFVTIFSVAQMFLVVVLAFLSAFIYNVIAGLVGGLHVVMTDD
ncbi:MAG: DUF3566 domain-containing protein [Actinomycetaceae bacterium]|nr:DUF3566 domain-containing protein [Actinomycetaceae bacterium]